MKEKAGWPVEPGEYEVCDPDGAVAVCTLEDDIRLPKKGLAVYGKNRTENLGLERIVVNVISNPNIRALVVCGREIRGHRSGQTLVALWKNGVDKKRRVIGAEGAIPYIQNIPLEFVERFRKQVKVFDLIDVVDGKKVGEVVDKIVSQKLKPYAGGRIDFTAYLPREEEVAAREIKTSPNTVALIPEYDISLNTKTSEIRIKKQAN